MMAINEGEVVRIRMAGFSGSPFSLNTSTSTGLSMDPTGVFGVVSWSNSSETLSLTVGSRYYLRRGQSCRITLQAHGEAALKLPVIGIRFNTNIFQIAADAADGYVLPTNFPVVQSVGTPSPGGAEIRFLRYRAGLITALSLSITPLMPIRANEVISIFLPHFRGPLPQDLRFDQYYPHGSWTIVDFDPDLNWRTLAKWDPASSELQLKNSFNIAENSTAVLNINEDARIRTPRSGVRKDDTAMQFAIAAYEGPVLRSSFDLVLPVGAFQGPVVFDYAPRIADVAINLTISFALWAPLRADETLLASLPDFGGSSVVGGANFSNDLEGSFESTADVQGLNASNSSNATWMNTSTSLNTLSNVSYFQARFSWFPNNSSLMLVASSDLPSGQRVRLTIKSDFGIRLPLHGIMANQSALTLSTNASLGPIEPTPVDKAPAVGAFIFSHSLRVATRGEHAHQRIRKAVR
jgi:hypothetical protein